MQTRLPDLPFPCKGIFSDPNDSRSSHESKPRAFPRTDLCALEKWTSFNLDIDNAIHSAMQEKGLPQNMQCTVGILYDEATQVWCEEEIRSHASGELHKAVQDVLKLLGIKGAFRVPGGGNRGLIGAPDFSWVSTGDGHPKLVVQCFTCLVLTVGSHFPFRPNTSQTGFLCYRICAGPLQKKSFAHEMKNNPLRL